MIRNIIFDLGNVLVKVDLKKFKRRILSEGVSESSFNKFFGSKKDEFEVSKNKFTKLIFEYETGKINTLKFISDCLKNLGGDLTRKKFIKHFNEMLVTKPAMKRIVIELKKDKRFNFLVLSNTNPLHWEYGKKHFPYVISLGKPALSYKFKLYKPDIRFYKIVLKKYNFKPFQTLYIDDHENNCLAAESLGINVIHYTDFNVFKRKFEKMLKTSK